MTAPREQKIPNGISASIKGRRVYFLAQLRDKNCRKFAGADSELASHDRFDFRQTL
jgi:hypothetical protein